MTVGELKELLNQFSVSDLVILSRDAEGNGFHELAGTYDGVFVSGDVYLRKLTPELEADGYTEDDVYDLEDGIDAVILYPVG